LGKDNNNKEIATPTINKKIEAEMINNSPQSVQQIKADKYLLIKDNKVLGDIATLNQLIKELEKIVTCENIKMIKVLLYERYGTNACSIYYYFNHDGSYLHLGGLPLVATIPTPSIKQKLIAESKNNPLQNVQPNKIDENYLLIKDNDLQEKSFDDLKKDVSKMSLDEIQKITIYNSTTKIKYKFSTQKSLFENTAGDMTLSDELTKHLLCTYKMLIVSAENPDNPFELTKKYICEKKVLIQDSEFNEMSAYRKNQPIIAGGEFKFDGLSKGYLVRIYWIKNNIIIGELNDRGIFHKNYFMENLAPGEYHTCQEAVKSYMKHIYEFRKKPLEEIKKTAMIWGRLQVPYYRLTLEHRINNNTDDMINFMIKANELDMYIT